MAATHTDADWEFFARQNPYWAVGTVDCFRRSDLTDGDLAAFFAAGEQYVRFVFEAIHRHLDDTFSPCSALDFGSGVGRLAIPLARRCDDVLGLDISETMLAEARKNCARFGLTNARFARGDDRLSAAGGAFDLIHSFIVFQHIPPKRGVRLFEGLLDRLRDGGVGVLHFTYAKEPPPGSGLGRLAHRLARAAFRSARRLLQLLQMWAPTMQMNPYDLNTLFLTLQKAGVRRLHVEYTDHGGCYGVVLFFQKNAGDSYRA